MNAKEKLAYQLVRYFSEPYYWANEMPDEEKTNPRRVEDIEAFALELSKNENFSGQREARHLGSLRTSMKYDMDLGCPESAGSNSEGADIRLLITFMNRQSSGDDHYSTVEVIVEFIGWYWQPTKFRWNTAEKTWEMNCWSK